MSINEYLARHPDLLNNFDASRDDYTRQYGSLSGYILADMRANGTPEERTWAATNGQRELDASISADGAATAIDDALRQGVTRAAQGGNTNQVQGSQQSGSYNTTGTTSQNQTSGQNQTGTQTGTSTTQATSGLAGTNRTQGTSTTNVDQTTAGTATRKVDDTLGFGKLLQSQQAGAAATDANRNAFLTDVMNTGGQQFNDQLLKGINSSLSGPGMSGVGVGAQGRVAGSAAADIGRNNLNQRLTAANQLAGPTAVGNLAQQGAAYNGETTASSNRTTGTNTTVSDQTSNFNQTGTNASTTNSTANTSANTTGWANALTNQTNGGTSNARSTQVATGQIPETQQSTSGGGGCMVCSYYVSIGQMHPGAVRRGVDYKVRNLSKYANNVFGYMLYGPFIVRAIRRGLPFKSLARAILYEECRLATPTRHKWRFLPWVAHIGFLAVSAVAAKVGLANGHSGRLEDGETARMIKSVNLWRNF